MDYESGDAVKLLLNHNAGSMIGDIPALILALTKGKPEVVALYYTMRQQHNQPLATRMM
jgi:hypothetical protein